MKMAKSPKIYTAMQHPENIEHGVFVKSFTGGPYTVRENYQKFIDEFTRLFPDFGLISQSQSECYEGVCLMVTYKV